MVRECFEPRAARVVATVHSDTFEEPHVTGAEPTIGLEGMKHHDPEPEVTMTTPAERTPADVAEGIP